MLASPPGSRAGELRVRRLRGAKVNADVTVTLQPEPLVHLTLTMPDGRRMIGKLTPEKAWELVDCLGRALAVCEGNEL
jgi:hypothetical protein